MCVCDCSGASYPAAEPGGDEDDAEAGGGGTDRENVWEVAAAGRPAEEAEDGGGRGETQIWGHGGERAAPAGVRSSHEHHPSNNLQLF